MYQALYRKYRPLVFDDVVSQAHITTTLQNQIKNGTSAHAYLFTGSRGTGKTTCARILAKAINCENPVNGNPCLECEICKDFENGGVSDIVEIDAASNNGVGDVRELRDATAYMPERCKFRVYIIDEVHMLSKDAFNALLKIMEEPPAHVKFILATTEVHKVLPTILSRCQRYDFHRILPEDIKDRLLYVSEKEKINLEPTAAELIAKIADGGMRDALSLLDQCIAFTADVTEEVVANAAGIANREYLLQISDAIVNKDAAKAISIVKKLYDGSIDISRLCEDLIGMFRNIMIAKSVPENQNSLVCMPSEIPEIVKLSEGISLEEIFEKLELLQKSNERIARVTSKRVELEMCLIKLCNKSIVVEKKDSDNTGLLAKIEELQRQIETLQSQPVRQVQVTAPQRENTYAPAQKKAEQKPAPVVNSQVNYDPSEVKPMEMWAEICEEFYNICPSAKGLLENAFARAYTKGTEGTMFVDVYDEFSAGLLKRKDKLDKFTQAAKNVTGVSYNIKTKKGEKKIETKSLETPPIEDIINKARENGIPTTLI